MLKIKTEADIRHYLRETIKYSGLKYYQDKDILFHFIPIETRTKVGIPDIYYYATGNIPITNGWIELKIGKKSFDNVKIRYEQGQRKWLNEHRKSNPRTFLLVYYNEMFFLFNKDIPETISFVTFCDLAIFMGSSLDIIWFIEKLLEGK